MNERFVATRMNFHDFYSLLNFSCGIVVITFACMSRSWLLAAGYVLSVPCELQILHFRLLRFLGIAVDDHPIYLYTINRILSASSVILITFAIVRLLRRRTPSSPST